METANPMGSGPPADRPRRDPQLSGPRRMIAMLLLAIGLMAAGGVAIVSAASPDPSASPTATSTPRATAGTSGGGSGGTASPAPKDCPNGPRSGTPGSSGSSGSSG
jgi:hypothetical protein